MDIVIAVSSAISLSLVWSGLLNLIYLPLALAYELRRRRPPVFSERTPLVTIVVPAYNEGRVIAACVESLLRAPYPRKQIILVDDGSTDDTLAVMRGFEHHPQVLVISKPNGGKAAALNRGLASARGEVVFFVDADGVFTERTIPEMLAGFEHARVGAVCGADAPVNLDRPQTHLSAIQSHVGTGFVRRALSLIGCLPIVSGNIGAFRRSALAASGPFCEGMLGEDLELTWRIHRAGYQVRFQPTALVYCETPSTLRGLWKQRVRWARGYLQTARIHRAMFGRPRYGAFGLYLPLSFFNTAVVPLLQLVVLALVPVALALGGLEAAGRIGLVSWFGLGSTFAITLVALALDRAWSHARYLYAVPLWLPYSLFMSAVMARALYLELRGAEQRWNKLDRVGIGVDGRSAAAQLANPLAALRRRTSAWLADELDLTPGVDLRRWFRARLTYEIATVRSLRLRRRLRARLANELDLTPGVDLRRWFRARLTYEITLVNDLISRRRAWRRRIFRLLLAAAVLGPHAHLATPGEAAAGPRQRSEAATPTPAPSPAPIRAVSLDFADLTGEQARLAELERRMRSSGVSMVGISAGRLDWTSFRWRGQRGYWSAAVRESSDDPFGAAASRFGRWAHVSAVVDVFAPRYLERHPDEAAIDIDGERSEYQASTAALTDGRFGDELILMLAYIARNYPVDSITLTELFYDRAGYGEDDLASYRRHSSRADWPRLASGAIDIEHPSIGAWRSSEVSRFVARAARAVQRNGKQLFVDVRVGWDDLRGEGRQSGHDYAQLLRHADRLVLWNYYGLRDVPPEFTRELAASVRRYGPERIIISYGMWRSGGRTLSAESLRRGVAAGAASPIPHAWVTPSSLLDDSHWAALEQVWSRAPR